MPGASSGSARAVDNSPMCPISELCTCSSGRPRIQCAPHMVLRCLHLLVERAKGAADEADGL
jgi:hypothetical protein